jgi:methyl-accepting chemotaxis protein
MMMTTLDARALVQESWNRVLPGAPAAAEAFYERLTDLDPQLGRLFRGVDMAERGRHLTRAITPLVRAWAEADGPERTEGHAWENPHLAVVASALFAMLERGLGPCLTASIRGAWLDFFACHAAELREAALGGTGSSRVVPLQRPAMASAAG